VILRRVLPAVAALASVALALRIWFSLAVTGDTSMIGDGLEFLGLGQGLADGRGYVSPFTPAGAEAVPSAHKPPLYPLLIAVVAWFGGDGHVPVQIASGVVGTGTVVVCAVLAHRLAGPRAAVVTAAIGAAYPVFLVADASLRAETLVGFCVALTLLTGYRAWERRTAWRLVQLGVAIGLATLARGDGLFLLVLIGLPVALHDRSLRRRLGQAAVVTGACLVVVAPWTARNWIVFDQPVWFSTNSGDIIAGANCAEVYSGEHIGSWSFACATGVSGRNEAVVSAELFRRGQDYMREHADRLPAVVAARALRSWGFYDPAGEVIGKTLGEGRSRTANWLGLAACWLLIALAVIGFVSLRRRGRPIFILLAPFVLVLFISVSSYGILRFRAPADVALVVLAGVAVDALLRRWRPGSGAAVGRVGNELRGRV
jgi:4-amino-4-deoxy-L-arabinose transferase-like glycosyltransferase